MKTFRKNKCMKVAPIVKSTMLLLSFLICIGLTACGKDDDDNAPEAPSGSIVTPVTPTTGKYKASDLYGVWTQTQHVDANGTVEVYNNAKDQWGITFNSDGTHGRWWHLYNGSAKNSDFKWTFSNDVAHIIDLSSGAECNYKIFFFGSSTTWLVLDLDDGSEDTYVKN